MNVPPRSVFCQFFVSCQDSCEPVIISGVIRITSPGPTSAPGPGGGEVSGSGSQALAAGWMWLDPGDSFRGSWERGGVSPPVSSLLLAMGPVQQFQSLDTWAPSSSHPLQQLQGRGTRGERCRRRERLGALGEAKSPLLCVPAASHHQHVEAQARTLGSDQGPFPALPLASGMTLPRTEPQFHHLSNGRDVPCIVVGKVWCLENTCLVLG